MWKKEKLLVTSNFSFFHIVFKRVALLTCKNQKGLKICINAFPNKLRILCVCSTSLLKTLWKKEKLLITSKFSFSHRVFYPFGKLSAIFINFEIVACKLFQFEASKICRLGKDYALFCQILPHIHFSYSGHQLPVVVVGCDGGSNDENSKPENVLNSSWTENSQGLLNFKHCFKYTEKSCERLMD